jgi:2,4-dienoyl-CoA reductase-like NADH-dependent reductase (Old Yellow Enzyme family)/thioredoxin reductase
MSYTKFLSPGKIGTLELKNRSIFPAMGTSFANPDGTVPQRTIDYHVRRVHGGCAMNIVEIAAVHHTSYMPNGGGLGIFDDKFIPGLTKLASAIKEAGGRACIQLWHGGRQAPVSSGQPWAPSAISCPVINMMPHAMTISEIKEVISSYGDAALRAKKSGFDAVEIHGAHGYLIDCFLNPYSNIRSDEYGGSLKNRARFGCEVIRDIRSKVGKDFPVLMRINGSENIPGGIVLEDAIKAAKIFEGEGIDAFNVSQGCYSAIAYTVPPYYYPIGLNIENASQIKKNVNIPILVAGRITTPELAEEILESDKADFICLGRIQLADPDFVKKTMEDRVDEIVKCVSCDQGCVERAFAGTGVSCVFNPATGCEKELIIKPAEKKKKILVIGGGPAGLEAARVASERGHEVTLFERTAKLGGQYLLAGFAPNKSVFADAAIHMGYRAQKSGVDIKLYTEATVERIEDLNPETIIVATGSNAEIPPISGIKGKNVFEARNVISTNTYISATNVVVIGGGLVGSEAAEILTEQGKTVSIVEMLAEIGKEMEMYIKPYYRRYIIDHNIQTYIKSKCLEIGENYVLIDKEGEEVKLECDAVIMATGSKSSTDVTDMVKALGYEYHVIGDASKPAKVLEAIWAGNEIGRTI